MNDLTLEKEYKVGRAGMNQSLCNNPHRPPEFLVPDLTPASPMMLPALTQERLAHGSVGSRGHGPGVLRRGIGGRGAEFGKGTAVIEPSTITTGTGKSVLEEANRTSNRISPWNRRRVRLGLFRPAALRAPRTWTRQRCCGPSNVRR